MSSSRFRGIPSVHELIDHPALKGLVDRVSHHVVVRGVRDFLADFREELSTRAESLSVPYPGELAERIAHWITKEQGVRLRPVVNATGVLLHTGLGRAPLSESAIDAIRQVAANYSALEVDIESGDRGRRIADVERLFQELTGAESVALTNNCAAATLLALSSLAAGRKVVVSRGELIEIGGSYRLPEIMAAGGAQLLEVGTTNKTRLSDYARACEDGPAAILKVHTSNYRIVGFSECPSLKDLVPLARRHRIPLIHDIGSGAMLNLAPFGLPDEPQVPESLRDGADLVLCSGDKLLGGPQCGIAAGTKELVRKLVAHPLMRAFRVDKLTIAALHATLLEYRDPAKAIEKIPVLSLLGTSTQNLRNRAERLAPQIAASPEVQEAVVEEGEAAVGGGTTPARGIPTCCVVIRAARRSVDELARLLRTGHPSVFGRVQKDRLWLDLRAVFPRQDQDLVAAFDHFTDSGTETRGLGNQGS